jgi:predicted transcriptional regulator
MTTITIQLPDDLARQVQQAGLLSSTTIEEILREKLKDRNRRKRYRRD